MENKKIVFSLLGAVAIGAHQAHESHRDVDAANKLFAEGTMVEPILYVRLPHGNEPEAPTGPLQTPWLTAQVSSTASAQIAGPVFRHLGTTLPST